MHTKIDQKHYELYMKLAYFEQKIEENKDQWKKSLADWITTKVRCMLEKQLQRYEINGVEFSKTLHELDCVQELLHLFNNKPLISVSDEENNQMNLNEPRLVFQTTSISGINLINHFSSDNSADIMKCSNQNQIHVHQFPDSEISACEYGSN